MEDFQKIIVQMLKVQMDHRQKSDERQQRMEERLMEQQVQQEEEEEQQQQKQKQQQQQPTTTTTTTRNGTEETTTKKWGKTPTSINGKWGTTEPNGRVTIKIVRRHQNLWEWYYFSPGYYL